MANRYWVGGSGTWNTTSTANWSTTSGGPSGASRPTLNDHVFFDSNSGGTYTVTLSSPVCQHMTVTAGTVTFGSGTILLYGNLTISEPAVATLSTVNWNTTGSVSVNDNSTLGSLLFDHSTGATVTFLTNVTCTGSTTHKSGIVNLNSKILTTTYYDSSALAVTDHRQVDFGTGKIVLTASTTRTICNIYYGSGTRWDSSGSVLFESIGGGSGVTKTINISSSIVEPGFKLSDPDGTVSYVITSPKITNLTVDGPGVSSVDTSAGTINILENYTNTVDTCSFVSTANAWTFSGNALINAQGVVHTFPIIINSTGIVQLSNSLNTTQRVTLTNGTLDLNGYTLTALQFYTDVGIKILKFNNGNLVLTGSGTAFNNSSTATTNFTTDAGTGTGTIKFTSAAAKTFNANNNTYYATIIQAGAGDLLITGGSNYKNIQNEYASVGPTSITFNPGTTNVFEKWEAKGASGNVLTVKVSSGTSPFILSKLTGTVHTDYMQLNYSTATGGATWYAGEHSSSIGTSGWTFGVDPDIKKGNFLLFFKNK